MWQKVVAEVGVSDGSLQLKSVATVRGSAVAWCCSAPVSSCLVLLCTVFQLKKQSILFSSIAPRKMNILA